MTVNLRKPRAKGQRLLPRGRRLRGRPRFSSTTSGQTSADATSVDEAAADARGEGHSLEDVNPSLTTQYPLTPWQSPKRTFKTLKPDKILPAIFATPFDFPDVQPSPSSDERPAAEDRTSIALITDKSCFRRQAVDSSSSQYILAQWLDLFFAQCPTWTPISPAVQQGLAYSVDMPLPLQSTLPPLPDRDRISSLTAVFFARIYPIFPVIDRGRFQLSLDDLAHKLDLQANGTLQAQDYPLLASAYAVLSAAADEEAGKVCLEGTQYFQAAYSLYARLVATPYQASVQALLLLTLILRNRNKDGASWGSLNQAICIAQSIGLHRHALYDASAHTSPTEANAHSPCTPLAAATTNDANLCARIWWVAYTLERTMVLETGRPFLIRDEGCDQIIPRRASAPSANSASFDYFHALIRLAQIKTRAIHHLYGGKGRDKSVRALLFEMGSIDRALMDWGDSFPDEIRYGI